MPAITAAGDINHNLCTKHETFHQSRKVRKPAPLEAYTCFSVTCDFVIAITICRTAQHSFQRKAFASIAGMACSFAGGSHCFLSCGDQAMGTDPSETKPDLPEVASRRFDQRPTVVLWETTQACDLSCTQCRVNSRPHRHPLELSTAEAFHLIDQIAAMKVPSLVLTGGDSLKRPDIFPIVQYAQRRGVHTSLTPSATPLLNRDAVFNLKQSGLTRLAISLDGSTAELHDGLRGEPGCYKRSLDAITWCHDAGLPVQVNTIISRRNFGDLDSMLKLLATLRIDLWSAFFLVPKGAEQMNDLLTPEEHELVFAKLYQASKQAKFHIHTAEGQHYGRYVLQQKAHESPAGRQGDRIRATPPSVGEGRGMVFVSHTGEVYPSGFLPLSAGNILWEPLAEIYQHSPLFQSLRDLSQLKGKCGHCDFKEVCGGSRARAYAMTHDVLGEEPCCAYVPA